jgi:hypothetical protein
MKTKKEVISHYGWYCRKIAFPAGSTARLATNLPLDKNGEKQYWLSLPRGGKYNAEIRSWGRVYGFLVSKSEIA